MNEEEIINTIKQEIPELGEFFDGMLKFETRFLVMVATLINLELMKRFSRLK